jgi:hypothetical protein
LYSHAHSNRQKWIFIIKINQYIKTVHDNVVAHITDDTKFRFRENQDHDLRLNELLIGEGNSDDRQNMKQIVNDLVMNEQILENYVQLLQNRIDLNKKTSEVRRLAFEIVKPIQNGDYDTKAKCCPTIWSLLRKYVL